MPSVSMTNAGIVYSDSQTPTGVSGGAVSTEVLDHYEEGDMTVNQLATSGGGNLTIYTSPAYNRSRYVRIGSLCTLHGGFIFSSGLNGTDGAVQIPLPFNCVTGPQLGDRSVGTFLHEGSAIYAIRVDNGGSFAKVEGTGGVDTYIQGSAFNNSQRIIFAITYTVA